MTTVRVTPKTVTLIPGAGFRYNAIFGTQKTNGSGPLIQIVPIIGKGCQEFGSRRDIAEEPLTESNCNTQLRDGRTLMRCRDLHQERIFDWTVAKALLENDSPCNHTPHAVSYEDDLRVVDSLTLLKFL